MNDYEYIIITKNIIMLHYTIGLEIHVKLSTSHKIFCACRNTQDFDSIEANTNICPICTAQPGALPILNLEVIDSAILLGKVFSSMVHGDFTRDRKSYFYPDSPVGFQITQFYNPIITWGSVSFFTDNFQNEHTIHIHEAHLENDTAKTITINGTTFIDFNRSWTPLIEIVTAPEFSSDEQVVEFLKELQRIIRFNNIGDADLDKGQMRVDVNISVKDSSSATLWNRVELKNINSFAAIRRGIAYEFERQSQIINNGWIVDQETRRRNDALWESELMRSKEQAMDYRYFPENDIPTIDPIQCNRNPDHTVDSGYLRIKTLQSYGFQKEFIYGLINNDTFYKWFSDAVIEWIEAKTTAKWILWPIANIINNGGFSSLCIWYNDVLSFLKALKEYDISETIAKWIMEEMLEWKKIEDLLQKLISEKKDYNLNDMSTSTIEQFPDIVAQYKWWKTTVIMFLVGQVMKATGWATNPQEVRNTLESLLNK